MTRAVLLALLLTVPALSTAGPETDNLKAEIVNLQDALVAVADERDALRKSLAAANAEVERLRAVADEQKGRQAACESDLTRAFDLNAALLASHRAMDGLLTQERKAAARQRWMDRLGFSATYAAVAQDGEFYYGPGVGFTLRLWP